ncbi:zinc finger domain-containing protein [Drechmeria coniospora]|uniref:Zinc finger domain-containing protein n=1 Tax=Drechmeria coniospora TaxID=98403 RepID=A0A151GVI1_DRECN|nr:zinc finger domain-containing protein [Drechmeria coniospora]KYK61063.1 zinc finger domain-containing protein [Drechmeria coniospora]
MHATKRKFNALLQGLSSPRSSSEMFSPDAIHADTRRGNAVNLSHDELLQKRRRLGFPDSTAPAAYNPSHTSTLSNVVLRRSTTQAAANKSSGTLAKYCPSDRDELLKRLATFQELTHWTPKPDQVGEIEWAKRGWVCHGKETVRCVLCHKELVVKLNRKEVDGKEVPVLVSSEIEGTLADKYVGLIVDSHQQECLWRKRGCDDSLLRLSFSSARAVLTALRQRYDELCSRSAFLPYEFNLRLPDNLNLDGILSQLPPTFFNEAAPFESETSPASAARPVNRAALALALMGWQGLSNARIGSVPNSASCHTCLRRLGLWMFKSKEIDDNGTVLVPAPMDHLDPLKEHRYFCPWKSAQAQTRDAASSVAGPNLAGWSTLLQMIKNEQGLRNVYGGQSKRLGRFVADDKGPSSPSAGVATASAPETPAGRGNPTSPGATAQDTGYHIVEEDERARDAKDKERWARLRKVKSLFDSKGVRKLRHPLKRPGTGNSSNSADGPRS